MVDGEPEGNALTRFNFRFFKIIEQYAFERPPDVWRAAKQQADRMVEFAADRWPGEDLTRSHVALLDFLSCSTLKTRGPVAVNILRWREAWANSSTVRDWTAVADELFRVEGRLDDQDGRLLAPLLWRYFKSDEKGSPRIIGQTYDVFRYLLNAPNVDEPAIDVPPDVRPVVTREAVVKVRQRSEPDLLKELGGYKCQLCGGAIQRTDDHPYVEAAHIQPFAGLTEDGVPGNYLVVCAHHHKAIDVGSPVFTLDPSTPPTFAMIEVQEMDGSRKPYKVIPYPRQATYGFWEAVRWRIAHPR
ncbi:MAG: HNH endonuclease [Candidatus Lutacidiplasmatales archaeon]